MVIEVTQTQYIWAEPGVGPQSLFMLNEKVPIQGVERTGVIADAFLAIIPA
jgi:hypothetical protein